MTRLVFMIITLALLCSCKRNEESSTKDEVVIPSTFAAIAGRGFKSLQFQSPGNDCIASSPLVNPLAAGASSQDGDALAARLPDFGNDNVEVQFDEGALALDGSEAPGSTTLGEAELRAVNETLSSRFPGGLVFSASIVDSMESVRSQMNITASAALSWGPARAEGQAQVLNTLAQTSNSKFVVIKATLKGQKQVLRRSALTHPAQTSLPSAEAGDSDKSAFYALCGDQYIYGVTTGASFYAVLALSEATSSAASEITAAATASLGAVLRASASASITDRAEMATRTASLVIVQDGTVSIPSGNPAVGDVMTNLRNFFVAAASGDRGGRIVSIELQDYAGVLQEDGVTPVGARAIDLITARRSLERLADRHVRAMTQRVLVERSGLPNEQKQTLIERLDDYVGTLADAYAAANRNPFDNRMGAAVASVAPEIPSAVLGGVALEYPDFPIEVGVRPSDAAVSCTYGGFYTLQAGRRNVFEFDRLSMHFKSDPLRVALKYRVKLVPSEGDPRTVSNWSETVELPLPSSLLSRDDLIGAIDSRQRAMSRQKMMEVIQFLHVRRLNDVVSDGLKFWDLSSCR